MLLLSSNVFSAMYVYNATNEIWSGYDWEVWYSIVVCVVVAATMQT